MTLNNLGNVQIDLGEFEAARESYQQALEIYWPLAQQIPRAFGQKFVGALREYASVAPEIDDNPWWQLWKSFTREASGDSPEKQAAPGTVVA